MELGSLHETQTLDSKVRISNFKRFSSKIDSSHLSVLNNATCFESLKMLHFLK